MSSRTVDNDNSSSDFEQNDLESLIRGARDYIVPGENLRPRVLEETRQQDTFAQKIRRVSLAACMCVFCWLLLKPIYGTLGDSRQSIVAPSSQELQHKSLHQRPTQKGSSLWGLVDTFRQARQLKTK